MLHFGVINGCYNFKFELDSYIGEMWLEKVLDTHDAVLDVGGVYDPSRDRFDHHQKGFNEILGNGFTTKLSSAGLVYKVIVFSISISVHSIAASWVSDERIVLYSIMELR